MLLFAALLGVSATALRAQSHEVATVIDLQGQVSVLRGGQVALFLNNSVRAKEEIVTGPDGYAKFQIRDGSTFEVFPNSRVTFQGEWTIEEMLQVVLGKIRVQIEHRNGPNHKRISTPTAVISVRGTIFDVNVEDIDGTTVVSVEQGQVIVRHLLQPGPEKILNENESVTIFPNQPLAKASGQSPAIKFVWDRVRSAVVDILVHDPGGVLTPNGGGLPGGQGDSGKPKKNPPTTAPPGTGSGGGGF